jgi:hypothetical protein
MHHFAKLHDSPGVKCPRCAARFLVAALAYHMEYIHSDILDKQVNDLVGPNL